MLKYVAYYRVSTEKQGTSKLGLTGQRKQVHDLASARGAKVVAEFTEIESGNEKNRPKLKAAIEECRLRGAKLLVAKFDRLSRNSTFLNIMLDGDVDLEAADNPNATKLLIRILAAVAQEEREAISDRTKRALAAAKARGVKLGGIRTRKDGSVHRISDYAYRGGEAAAPIKRAKADVKREALISRILEIKKDRPKITLKRLSQELARRGYVSKDGNPMHASTLSRIIRGVYC